MRTIEYLSPTSIGRFRESPKDFYMDYLADYRAPRFPQTAPMSVGSAFDAYVKSFLYESIIGKNPKFELRTLFDAQVEPQNRDKAYDAGKILFEKYKASGALSDLMLDLQSGVSEPRFEISVQGVINGYREGVSRQFGSVMLLGKPDVFYINKHGAHVILDWKVNGFYSKNPVSPKKGYVRCRPNGGQHKDAMCHTKNGVLINYAHPLELVDTTWADQLSIYGWLCGMEIGSDFITAIDQICCAQGTFRVAEHRTTVSKHHQQKLFDYAQELWDRILSGHFFTELTLEESKAKCSQLDDLYNPGKPTLESKDWFDSVTERER